MSPLQKLPPPVLDTLLVPPFESETKRATINAKAAAGTTAAKQMQLPVLESGTSVAPRQRPKASVQAVAHTLPIVAPPSPSPRNVVSPVPATQSNPPSAEVVEEPPFTAQFQANFPPVQTPVAVTPQYSATASQSLQTSTSNSVTNVSQADGTTAAPDNLDSLFESKFPDPFRESAAVAGVPRSVRTGSSGAIGSDLGKVSAFGSQDVVMPLETVVATPTKASIQQLLGAPKLPVVGHRRNMSDTSAFNKYNLPRIIEN